jgi:DUF971 family protein
MPLPIDPRGKPASVKIHVSTGAGVDITWSDGHTSHYDFVSLREQCPCAACDEERRRKAQMPSTAAALPLYKPKPRAVSAQAVGNYAIQITFNDGHATGIYSFEYLRHICPCAECAATFRAQESKPK